MAKPHYTIVGAGFAGAVLARSLVDGSECEATVVEARSHLGGNCHTERDPATNILLHKYGQHTFNTNREDVWRYVNRFARFRPFVNRVKARTDKGIFSLPVNLHTLNQFFGESFSPSEARDFIASIADTTIGEPANFEEQALKTVGRALYEEFFYGHTKKQWGCEPRDLPASVFKRLSVRFDYNDSYYDAVFQGMPEDGFTEMVRTILDHERIGVRIGAAFDRDSFGERSHLFYTGPLDAYFGFKLGRLGYRTIVLERGEARGDFQGCPIMSYPEESVAYTRIHEHKHFAPWERHEDTVYFKEFSKETAPGDPPFYPKRLAADVELLERYLRLAESEEATSFLGRLGTYRYLNMDQVIGESLDFAALFIKCVREGMRPPSFSVPRARISANP